MTSAAQAAAALQAEQAARADQIRARLVLQPQLL